MKRSEEYRQLQIEFVTGLKGSTFWEVEKLTLFFYISTLFSRSLIQVLFGNRYPEGKAKRISLFIVEFLSFALPNILILAFSDYFLIIASAVFLLIVLFHFLKGPIFCSFKRPAKHDEKFIVFIGSFRGALVLCTAISILAVDFHFFPRKFAKTEDYGISHMDIGVGTFVMSNALVSQPVREYVSNMFSSTHQNDEHQVQTKINQTKKTIKSTTKNQKQNQNKNQNKNQKKNKNKNKMQYKKVYPKQQQKKQGIKNVLNIFLKSLKGSSPILIIGLLRLYLTKSVNYQEHVSEYGAHWNFFVSLAFLSLFYSLISHLVTPKYSGLFGVILLAIYQTLLSKFGLAEWILSDQRRNLFEANKEGACSLVGYLALFLIGSNLGYLILKNVRSKQNSWKAFTLKLVATDILLFVCAALSHAYIQKSSRKMVNCTYCLFVLSNSILSIVCFSLIDSFTVTPQHQLQSSFTKNQLPMFLFANMLTGLINICFETLYINNLLSAIILSIYMLLLTSSAQILKNLNINLKFW
ncbi:phosphatidylinositol-glycan biosynthesis class w protein [Anaeramoeba flamelloides]|uniref:Phosphatidylinositol-glycan biosynthesis class w protein n=1 Tax=Anaeramoeba flamelloides TaxID=1746091 RepID=A0ABQ8YPR5_9EUKA|nr:phosphatidylinositol-glycan biosynthesis class w protein [Anaeramoeba flamelloides]